MATFGLSVPDDVKAEIDDLAGQWGTDRSKALVRVFKEWQLYTTYIRQQLPQATSRLPLPTLIPAPTPEVTDER